MHQGIPRAVLIFIFVATTAWSAEPRMINAEESARRFGLETHWDPFLKNLTVEKDGRYFTFHAGSAYILYYGRLVKLPAKARFADGVLWVPESFEAEFKKLSEPEPRPEKKLLRFTTADISQALYGSRRDS